jgi:hypothetical protein
MGEGARRGLGESTPSVAARCFLARGEGTAGWEEKGFSRVGVTAELGGGGGRNPSLGGLRGKVSKESRRRKDWLTRANALLRESLLSTLAPRS